MIDLLKEIIGITTNDYDIYIVVISIISIMWIVKTVINGIFNSILQIFK